MSKARGGDPTSPRLSNDCFALPPGAHWTPVDEALAALRKALRPVAQVESLSIEALNGRFVAEEVIARRDHPATDNAAVDGYAFAHPGGRAEAVFELCEGRSAAGAPWSGALAANQAVRILTGGEMPEGADTVALQEDATVEGRQVRLLPPKNRGANRRRAGENIEVGAVVLKEGARVSPQAVAQLASAGLARVDVYRPLKVAIISTGDELAAPGSTRLDHQVIDANGPMLAALIQDLGAEVALSARVSDDRAALEATLDEAARKADAILTSGGASAGEEDHLSAALQEAAAREEGGFHLWRVAVKPGRPLAMGMWKGAPLFGLPGNPVAAFVCFAIFARPALTHLGGGAWTTPKGVLLPSGFNYPKKRGRREFLRVRLGEDGRLEKFRSEGSGLISGLLWSDGLADLPHEAGPLSEGDPVRFLSYTELGIRA
ncbi:MAG: molybdopterin-binding protein [Neomegalonema sp.]|nr:molybdopterin-binding protein [Neomegalonema sp.]